MSAFILFYARTFSVLVHSALMDKGLGCLLPQVIIFAETIVLKKISHKVHTFFANQEAMPIRSFTLLVCGGRGPKM